jgi:hypothetical protein
MDGKHDCTTSRPLHLPTFQFRLVPVEGIEPPLLAERDFESRASTSSATRATGGFLHAAMTKVQAESGPQSYFSTKDFSRAKARSPPAL